MLDHQLAVGQFGALGEHLPGEQQGVGYDLAQVADPHVDAPDRSPGRSRVDGVEDGLTDRELVHG
jgi:hypothetical protein